MSESLQSNKSRVDCSELFGLVIKVSLSTQKYKLPSQNVAGLPQVNMTEGDMTQANMT